VKPDGEPAYPSVLPGSYVGMSLRDYFAGQALAGYCASQHPAVTQRGTAWVVEHAYIAADAMLTEREKG
jgi:hypothetical protein